MEVIDRFKLLEDFPSLRTMSMYLNIEQCREYNDCVKRIRLLIEQHPTIEVPTWISCSERLPEENEDEFTRDFYEYIVTVRVCDRYDVRYYKFGRGKWWNGGADMSSIVTAWQPLPQPYVPK